MDQPWPIHEVVLVDDQLELEVPILVIDDAELGFKLRDGMVLDGVQIEELTQKLCSQKWHAPVGVSDAFGVVRDKLVRLMQRQVGEGDAIEARRVGRIVAIVSLFDAGVDYLRIYWSLVFNRASNGVEKVDRDAYDSGAEDRRSAADMLKMVHDLIVPDLKLIVRGIKKSEEHCEVAALRAMLILDLQQACKLLNTSDTTLRANGQLNDLDKHPSNPSKLNGRRKGTGIQAPWQFKKEEVERFASNLPGMQVT